MACMEGALVPDIFRWFSLKDGKPLTAHPDQTELECREIFEQLAGFGDIRAGQHVRAIPDDLAQDVLEHAGHEAGPDEEADGDL